MSTLAVDAISNATGTQSVTIDSNGYMHQTNPIAFHVVSTTVRSAVNFNLDQNVLFDQIDFNYGNCVSLSSNVATFTAPVSGLYHINSSVQFDSLQAADWSQTTWYINGATTGNSNDLSYRTLSDPNGAAYWHHMQSQVIELSANDTVKVMGRTQADTSINVRNGCRFSGYFIG